jgi:uncharacterized membrane protein YqiK
MPIVMGLLVLAVYIFLIIVVWRIMRALETIAESASALTNSSHFYDTIKAIQSISDSASKIANK